MPDREPPSTSPAQGAGSEPFNPATLDRSVIATPLLEQITKEKADIEKVRKKAKVAAREFNSVIVLRDGYSVGAAQTRAAVQKVLDEAVTLAKRAAMQRAALERETPGQTADREADENSLGPRNHLGGRVPTLNALFAWLDARIIHRILATQTRELRRIERKLREELLDVIIEKILPSRFQVIIDLNLEFLDGRETAGKWVEAAIREALEAKGVEDRGQGVNHEKSLNTNQYVFATLQADVISRLVEMDGEAVTAGDLEAAATAADSTAKQIKAGILRRRGATADSLAAEVKRIPPAKLRAIYHIWPDFEIRSRITRSIATVKANAAISSFAARGKDITWAVMDTGIQGDHPHFVRHKNIADPTLRLHRDFTTQNEGPLIDSNGHGTHVAGIIAGEWIAAEPTVNTAPATVAGAVTPGVTATPGVAAAPAAAAVPTAATTPPAGAGGTTIRMVAVARYQDEHGDTQQDEIDIKSISGMAPECRLVSLKVLDEDGIGNASNLIAAIAHVQEINGNGRRLLIHGVNISIGYDFDPKWFACGQSPLCVEVDRLVRSGVVVVVAAGNTGYGAINNGSTSAGLTVTINDPGNADLAITVGATHRDMPHVYGVSYFSSKGPTGDGRLKPDLVAPGERIVSSASSLPPNPDGLRLPSELKREVARDKPCEYIETSGTSMAAPHVSGVIAAFLSVRREFIGRPEQVKQIFVSTCTDLHRDRYFQGAGLVDLMRAIQSV